MDLSIIIVNYNTKELTKQCIDSVTSSIDTIDYELIIIDNASSDNSVAYLKDQYAKYNYIHIIDNDKNLGFSKANNLGIRHSSGKNILLLNPDTIVSKGCIELCLQYILSDPTIGALGCKVLLPSGDLDHACKRGFPTPTASLYYFLQLHRIFPKNPKYCQYTLSHLDQNQTHEVDSLTGAFMLIPRKIIDQVGFLDEDFFMYGEDIDWCYRIKEQGFKVIYYPPAKIIHIKGQSSKKKRTKTLYEFHRAMILFYKKHYKKKYPFAIFLLIYSGVWGKYCITLLTNLFKKR